VSLSVFVFVQIQYGTSSNADASDVDQLVVTGTR